MAQINRVGVGYGFRKAGALPDIARLGQVMRTDNFVQNHWKPVTFSGVGMIFTEQSTVVGIGIHVLA